MKNQKQLSIFLILLLVFNLSFTVQVSIMNSNQSKTNTNSSAKSSTTNNSKVSLKSQLNSKIGSNLSFIAFKSKKNESSNKKDEEEKKQEFSDNVGYSPLWKGWIKYFYYETSKKISGPSDFFVNNYYFSQRVVKDRLLAKGPLPNEKNSPETNTYINIPSKFHFFAYLTPNYLEIDGDRKNSLTTKLEALNLDLIDPLLPSDMEKTGVKEIGKFEEGFCLDLSTHHLKSFVKDFMPTSGEFKDSTPVHWIICFEDKTSYSSFLNLLSSVLTNKELNRKRANVVVDGVELKNKEDSDVERYQGFDANPILDGYLVRINDWTQCTLKCGGGWSFQQWKCIPPKEGGKPCMGELIRKKTCNNDPCPQIGKAGGNSQIESRKVESVIEKPIIKSQVVSNRLQQNIDCVIREEDVLHTYEDKESGKVAIPSRIILNRKTISLFSDIDDKKTLFSYDIRKTLFVPISNDNCCLKIRNENKEFKICGMSQCKTFVSSWLRSIDLFKDKCYNLLDNQPFDPNREKVPTASDMDNSLAMTMEMSNDMASVKQEAIKKKLDQQNTFSAEKNINKTEKEALSVISREIDIEDLIRKEEMKKNQEKIQMKVEEFKHEEKKKKKLDEAIEKQQESQTKVLDQIKAKKEVIQIKVQTVDEVEKKRNQLKQKIIKIRKLAERRAKTIQQKINIIRNEMSNTLIQSTKKGNADTCKNNLKDVKLIESYCESNLIDDIGKYMECKIPENHCFVCCDNEFGNSNFDGKQECYNKCIESDSDKLSGEWKKKEEK